MHGELWKKTGESDASKAKVGKLEKRLTTLRDAPKENEKKIERIELSWRRMLRILLNWRRA